MVIISQYIMLHLLNNIVVTITRRKYSSYHQLAVNLEQMAFVTANVLYFELVAVITACRSLATA